MHHFEIDTAYELKLKELERQFKEKRATYLANRPYVNEDLLPLMVSHGAPAYQRMFLHTWKFPGARTDEISEACAIGNVSDAATNKVNRESQQKLGIVIRCEVEPAINRYGQKTIIGRWWIDIVDPDKFMDAVHKWSSVLVGAANDPIYDAANDPDYGDEADSDAKDAAGQ